jgi:hypothetical protein
MKISVVTAIVIISLTAAAGAQGIIGGAAEGVHEGNRAAGPIGGVVGGAVGAGGGGIAGILDVDQRPRFRAYASRDMAPMRMTDRSRLVPSFPVKALLITRFRWSTACVIIDIRSLMGRQYWSIRRLIESCKLSSNAKD